MAPASALQSSTPWVSLSGVGILLTTLLVAWRLHERPRVWKGAMVVASLAASAWWDPRLTAVLVGLTLTHRWLAVPAARGAASLRRIALASGVILSLAALAAFRIAGTLSEGGIVSRWSIAPVAGVTFLALRSVAYLVDVGRGRLRPLKTLDLALYLGFLPYLAGGPLVRPGELLRQLDEPRNGSAVDAGRAARRGGRALVGLLLVAPLLADAATRVLRAPGHYHSLALILAGSAMAVQVMVQFASFSDLGAAIGLLFGVRLPVDFDAPFSATSLIDHLRGWHRTFVSWVREDVVVPVGGDREGLGRRYGAMVLGCMVGMWLLIPSFPALAAGALAGVAVVAERTAVRRRRAGVPVLGVSVQRFRRTVTVGGDSERPDDPRRWWTTDEIPFDREWAALRASLEGEEQPPGDRLRPWARRLGVAAAAGVWWGVASSPDVASAGRLLGRVSWGWFSGTLSVPWILPAAVALAVVWRPLGAPRLVDRIEARMSGWPPIVLAVLGAVFLGVLVTVSGGDAVWTGFPSL